MKVWGRIRRTSVSSPRWTLDAFVWTVVLVMALSHAVTAPDTTLPRVGDLPRPPPPPGAERSEVGESHFDLLVC